MRHQLIKNEELVPFFNLSQEEEDGFKKTSALFTAGVSPYYAGVISRLPPEIGGALRAQVIPSTKELSDSLGVSDPLKEVDHSPVKEIVHVYPDRVAWCVAQLCPVYCRYCYRKRRDDEEGLHYNRKIIETGLEYIASHTSIRDVLITGGDPFIASDEAIEKLLQRLREIDHVEVIRFGTRTPVALPYRITKRLCSILAKYHPIWVNTHFNSVHELTPEAIQGINNLLEAGIPVGNQSVLLKGVNDSLEDMLALCRKLIRHRIRPYYVFHCHLVEGTEHLRVPVAKGLEIMSGLRGKISGFGIPTYILDTPSGKVPLTKNHVLGADGKDLLVEDLHGEIWREKNAAL